MVENRTVTSWQRVTNTRNSEWNLSLPYLVFHSVIFTLIIETVSSVSVHVRSDQKEKTWSATPAPNLEIQGHSWSLTQTPPPPTQTQWGKWVCGGGCKRRWCSDNMASMQHPCISMNSRHFNICSEVLVNIKLPLTKFSNNDLRLLWNVSHISVTSLGKQFCLITVKYLKSLGASMKSMAVNHVAGDKLKYLEKITLNYIEKAQALLTFCVGWNTLWWCFGQKQLTIYWVISANTGLNVV